MNAVMVSPCGDSLRGRLRTASHSASGGSPKDLESGGLHFYVHYFDGKCCVVIARGISGHDPEYCTGAFLGKAF